MKLLLATLLACLFLGAGGAAAAPEDDGAFRAEYARALHLYQERRYEEAVSALQAAYALRPDPRLHLNLGHAFRRLGRPEEALHHYQRYQAEIPQISEAEKEAVSEYIAATLRLQQAAAPKIEEPPLKQEDPPPAAPKAEPPRPMSPPPTVVPLPQVRTTLTLPPVRAPEHPVPVYKRWWFWGVVGLAAAGGVAAAVLASQPWDPGLPPGAPVHDPKF